MDQQTVLFSNKSLMAMIIPLFLEQLLIMLVGMADTLVVSYAGEAAVSGVSLVNQFNTIFIYLFTALASGGAVVISQYIGRKKNDDAGESASQLLSYAHQRKAFSYQKDSIKKQNGTPFVRQVYEYACAGKWGVFYMAQRLRQWLFWFSSRVRVATMPDLPDRRM